LPPPFFFRSITGLSGGPNAPRVLNARLELQALQSAWSQDEGAIAAATEKLEKAEKKRDDSNAKIAAGGGQGAGKLKRTVDEEPAERVTLTVDGFDVRQGKPFIVQLNGTVSIPKGAWEENEWGKGMLALCKSTKAGDSDGIILRKVIWKGGIGGFEVSQRQKLSDKERKILSAFLKRFVFSRHVA